MTIWLGEILDALVSQQINPFLLGLILLLYFSQYVRKGLDAKYEVLVNEARKMKLSNTEKWWRNAVLWEFCELDQTHDK